MGIKINVNAKQDYSYLFSSLNQGKSGASGMSNFLSEYASIKSGSYGKLMRAYYSKDASKEVKSAISGTTSDAIKRTGALSASDTKAYTQVQSTSDDLKESADKLLAGGNKSVFQKKDITTKDENGLESTTNDYDRAGIYSAVSSFIKDYNSVVDASGNVDSTNISNRVANMENTTAIHEKALGKLGITINKDQTLSIDKDTFMKADMDAAKSLFQGSGSYAYSVSASASMINYNADYELSRATTYDTTGSFQNAYNVGNLFSIYS